MKKTLLEVDDKKGVIITSDGKEYYVSPGDLTICCMWLPMSQLEFTGNQVKNINTGETITLLGF